jgi:hypothetical protein
LVTARNHPNHKERVIKPDQGSEPRNLIRENHRPYLDWEFANIATFKRQRWTRPARVDRPRSNNS